jgi:Cu/Ag efflux protein CusF
MSIPIPSLPKNTLLLSIAFVILISALLAGGCQTQTAEDAQAPAKEQAAETAPQRYALHGKVVSLNEENKIAAIDHQEIVGWMGAMTMEFPVREQSEWEKLHVGEQINATVFVDATGFHLGEIEVVTGEGQAPQ